MNQTSQQHAPRRIKPQSLGDYLEEMSKVVFQTGISWRVVESKWPGIRVALQGFDTEKTSKLSKSDLDKLVKDTRVIRNRRKLEAIVENARTMIRLEKEHGSFRNYLRANKSFEEVTKDLRKHFKFLGEIGSYHFLYVVGEKVPSYEKWCASSGRKHGSDG